MPDPQPVLEVEAISYAEVEQQQRDRAGSKSKPSRQPRSASKQTGKSKPARPHKGASAAVRPSSPSKPEHGQLGTVIVAEVEANKANGMNASQAIEQVAAERGMKATAVSGNYYRMLRSQKLTPSPGRPPKASATVGKVTDRIT